VVKFVFYPGNQESNLFCWNWKNPRGARASGI